MPLLPRPPCSYPQATTVGYGDIPNATQAGRLWSCFHILVSVALLGEIIQTFDELRARRAKTMARIRMLTTRLTEPMLDHLLEHATVLRPKIERDGLGLTELEFVLVREPSTRAVDACRRRVPFTRAVDACRRRGRASTHSAPLQRPLWRAVRPVAKPC